MGAPKKITALTAVSALVAADLFAVVDDPGGTPVTKKITYADLLTQIETDIAVPADQITAGALDIGVNAFTVNSIEIVGSDGEVNKAAVEDSGNWDTAYTHSQGDGSDHADVATNTVHSTGDGSDHADVATNTVHSTGDGSDHSDVALNNTHRSSTGADHTYIDQSVVSGAAPTFSGITALAGSDITISGAASWDVIVKLSDAAGARTFRINDSGDGTVATIDSDGNADFGTGTLDCGAITCSSVDAGGQVDATIFAFDYAIRGNTGNYDYDSWIGSTVNDYLMYWDAGNGYVGVNMDDPDVELEIAGNLKISSLNHQLVLCNTSAAEGGQIVMAAPATDVTGQANNTWMIDVVGTSTDGDLRIFSQDNSGSALDWWRLNLNSGGQPVYQVNPASGDIDYRVHRDGDADGIFMRASDGRVTIGHLAGTGSRTVVADASGNLSAP